MGWEGKGGKHPQIKLYDCTALSIAGDWFESLTILAAEPDVVCTLSILMRIRSRTHLRSVHGACINILCR
jgi:hypothetical protein